MSLVNKLLESLYLAMVMVVASIYAQEVSARDGSLAYGLLMGLLIVVIGLILYLAAMIVVSLVEEYRKRTVRFHVGEE